MFSHIDEVISFQKYEKKNQEKVIILIFYVLGLVMSSHNYYFCHNLPCHNYDIKNCK